MDWIDPPVDRRSVARRSARLLLLGAGMVACASLMSSLIPRQSSAAGNGGGRAAMPMYSPAVGKSAQPGSPSAIGALDAPDLDAAPLKDAEGRPLLGTLRTATHWLWFYAAPDEPLVTICDRRGKILAAAVPQSDVYRLFPELNLDQLQDTPESRQLMHADPARDGD